MLDPVKLRLNYAHDLSDSSSILLVVRIKPSLDLEPVAVFEKKKGKKKRSQTNLYSHGRSAISFLFSLPLPPLPLDLRAFYSTFPIPDDEREKESNWNARQIRIIRYWLIPSASIAVAINVKHQTKPTFPTSPLSKQCLSTSSIYLVFRSYSCPDSPVSMWIDGG